MNRRHRDEAGTSAVEYALLASLIAAVIVIAVTSLGLTTSGLFDRPCQEAGAALSAC